MSACQAECHEFESRIPLQLIMKYENKRKCGTCTVCCEGTLGANIHGHNMHPGMPCHFLDMENHKCSIYKDRPKDICVPYKCAWLSDPDGGIPEWMKPNLSGVLISIKPWNDRFYWNIIDTKPYKPSILYWIFTFTEQRNIPIEIKIDGMFHVRGPKEFHEFLNNSRKPR